MAYKTVNLRPATYERLKMYQGGGKSLGDVIEELMDLVEPELLYRRELLIHRKRVKEMRAGKAISLEDLDRDLRKSRRK